MDLTHASQNEIDCSFGEYCEKFGENEQSLVEFCTQNVVPNSFIIRNADIISDWMSVFLQTE